MFKKLLPITLLVTLITAFVACNKNDSDDAEILKKEKYPNGFVDLGLTSGILWSTTNIGADNPQDYGDYYAWGETTIKSDFKWNTYKYCIGSYTSLTKYCNNSKYGKDGFSDALTTLEVVDDVATIVLGADYSIPTVDDWNELSNQCYWVWTPVYNKKNISGYIVYKAKSKGDKGIKVYKDGNASASYTLADSHIFLPAAGDMSSNGLGGAGKNGGYWSASLLDDDPRSAWRFSFSENYAIMGDDTRYWGYSIRPVYRP